MDGLWSNPCGVPRVAYDEEANGDIGTFGIGTLSGYGVGGDTHMLGPGRLSGDNHDHEDINWNGLGSIRPISMSGNTVHEDHCGDLTKGGGGRSPSPSPPPLLFSKHEDALVEVCVCVHLSPDSLLLCWHSVLRCFVRRILFKNQRKITKRLRQDSALPFCSADASPYTSCPRMKGLQKWTCTMARCSCGKEMMPK